MVARGIRASAVSLSLVADRGSERSNDIGTAVRRTIVNNNHLDRTVRLRQNACDRGRKVTLPVVYRDNDADELTFHLRHASKYAPQAREPSNPCCFLCDMRRARRTRPYVFGQAGA